MTDVIVYGATSAGVCAAVAAAQEGASVRLLEPGQHVGGMTSGGLGYTDLGDPRVLGGPAARYRQEIADHYRVPVGHYAGPEPHVAEQIFCRWLEQAGVEVSLGAGLRIVTVGADRRITEIVTADGRSVGGQVFIDASYEGDLLAAAGVPYAIGREDVALYGESLAGRREVMPGRHSIPPISPWLDGPGRLLPQIKPEPMVPVGVGDGGVMSYGYRVCLTQAPDRIEFMPSDDYDPDYWELGRRLFEHWRGGVVPPAGWLIGLEPNLPGGKCDGNSLGPFSLSVLDGSAWRYPDADWDCRERIVAHHRRHAQDFLYFLSHDDAVPAEIRAEISRWGLPRDEFADTGHLPHQLYVREARRMIGQYVLTQHDLMGGGPGNHLVDNGHDLRAGQPRRHADAIAMGSYHIDIREVQRAWRETYEHPDPVAITVSEGYLSVRVRPYQIPYRCLIPRYEDCVNLLVPVCLSASQVAFASVRMEVQYQMLGHAAGLAAAQASRRERPVQTVDVAALQEQLVDSGQVLAL